MNRERYDLIPDRSGMKYDFFSTGPKGIIWKVIQFREAGRNLFCVSFGDWDEARQKIDDRSISNNLDRDKVLSTVAFAVLDFLGHFPEASVAGWGSTPGRTRLYQMAINANWFEINMFLHVYGYIDGQWVFMERGKNYHALMVSKINIFNFSKLF